MISLLDFKTMSLEEVEKTLASMSLADKNRISAEGRKQHRGMRNNIDYKKHGVNVGIYKNGVLVGDRNAKDDTWEEI